MLSVLVTGTVLSGRYEILRVLGQGGMGAVYLAKDLRLPVKRWAVKEMASDIATPEEMKEAVALFEREAYHLAQMDHPNLPKVVDYFSEAGRQYIIMEFVEGETLEKIVMGSGDPLPLSRLMEIAMQLLDVLEYLHSRKPAPIIFRDMKPANIMITRDGRVKLIDFGIARIFAAEKSRDTIAIGTPGFAAPEQYGTGQTDQRSDIYSLGATLIFAVTKFDPQSSPFRFPSLSSLNPAVPKGIEEILARCVRINPEERPSSVAELRNAFLSLGAESIPTRPLYVTAPISAVPAQVPGIFFDPAVLDFGLVKRGEVKRLSFQIRGDVKGTMSSDRRWLRVNPSSVKGKDPAVEAIAYTSSLVDGGYHPANMVLCMGKEQFTLPAKITVEPVHLNFWSYVFASLFTLFSFIPVLGYLGLLLLLSIYYSCPRGERASLKVLVSISAVGSALWTLVLLALTGFLLLRLYPGG